MAPKLLVFLIDKMIYLEYAISPWKPYSDYILKDYRTRTNPPYSMLIDGVGCNPQLG